MSLAHTAAEYMLSDALLPDRRGPRLKGLRLELPLDRVVKFISVGSPLLLMSLAFAQEFSSGKWLLRLSVSERLHFVSLFTCALK